MRRITWRRVRRRRKSPRPRLHRPPQPAVPRDRVLESARSVASLALEGVRCRPLPHSLCVCVNLGLEEQVRNFQVASTSDRKK